MKGRLSLYFLILGFILFLSAILAKQLGLFLFGLIPTVIALFLLFDKWLNHSLISKDTTKISAIIEMHDNKGIKHKFEYLGIGKHHPNQSHTVGYGSEEWMFLCKREESECILSFEVGSAGYGWASVDIPKSSYDKLVKKRAKGIFETFHSYFKFEERRIIGLHPDNIEVAKKLVDVEYTGTGRITDEVIYGQMI